MILTVVECLVLAGWACIVLYCLILCLASWMARSREAPLIWPRHVFAVLIPAQNAETTIGHTLERFLHTLQYPREMFDLIVVPVQCTDRTAAVARQKGALVHDQGRREGMDRDEAIQSSIERLLSKRRHDAFVILEAEVDVSPNFLAVMSDQLSKGAQVVQAGYQIAGPLPSWTADLAAARRAVSAYLCPLWNNRLRLFIGLQRVGMCLARSVVEKYGVRTPGITEGMAYTARLLLDEVPVVFASNALVFESGHPSPAPVRRSLSQRFAIRWHLIRQYTIPLLWTGIQWRSATRVSGAINLLLPPFSWLFGGSLVMVVASVLSHRFILHPGAARLLMGWALVIAGQIVIVVNGCLRAHVPALVYLALPFTPLYLLWQACQSGVRGWVRRTGEATSQNPVLSPAGGPLPGRRVTHRSDVRKEDRAQRGNAVRG